MEIYWKTVSVPCSSLYKCVTRYSSILLATRHCFSALAVSWALKKSKPYVRSFSLFLMKTTLLYVLAFKPVQRTLLMQLHFDIYLSQIAKTLAFCVGRIARKDYPKEWYVACILYALCSSARAYHSLCFRHRPDLFDRLLGAMQHAHESIEQGHSQARIVLHRALLFFQQAVKALSENRTMAGKNIIGRVGPASWTSTGYAPPYTCTSFWLHAILSVYILPQLCEQGFVNLSHFYQHVFQRALHDISANNNAVPSLPENGQPSDLDLSLLIFKILSKLVVYGWGGAGESPERKEEFTNLQKSFFISSMQDFTTIYQARQAILLSPSNSASLSQQAQLQSSPLITLNKHTLAYGKMYLALLFQNHIIFHSLGQTAQLVQLYWSFVQQASQSIRTTDLGERILEVFVRVVDQWTDNLVRIQKILLHCSPSNSSCSLSFSWNIASLNSLIRMQVSQIALNGELCDRKIISNAELALLL